MSDDDNNIQENMEAVRELLADLTIEEAKILKEKFGNTLLSDTSIEEVNKQFDVVRERIQQIEEKALNKLARKKELEALPKCSFCKLRSDQVKKLIAAPDSDVFICDGCIGECLQVLEE